MILSLLLAALAFGFIVLAFVCPLAYAVLCVVVCVLGVLFVMPWWRRAGRSIRENRS